MSDQAVPRVEVSIGDVHHSQLVVGDHNTIQTAEGTEVTVLQVSERPVPRLRAMPISRRPGTVEIVGREGELALIASADAETPVQLYAPDGAGKTSLIKVAARQASAPAEGVVFESARHRSLDEIQAGLFAAFWACDVPFIPAPAQLGDFLADREALLFLDDCGVDRSETETLIDSVPRCTVVLASEARTLWSRGTAQQLADLDPLTAVRLIERELGQSLDSDERAAAERVVARLGGNPQSLVEMVALIEDGRGSLRDLGDDPSALERRLDPSALTDSQKRILEILSALEGVALGIEHVSALAGLPEAEGPLRALERRGWVKAASPRYRSVRQLPPEAAGSAREEIAKPLLGHLTAWSGKAGPQALGDEREAIERALELGAETERWQETLALSLAAERGLFVAGAWSSCRRVLRIGLRAARAVENQSARAYLLHQLGSQSLCLGDRAEAGDRLTEALHLREELGEHAGAELTRHNLSQLGGGGDGGPDDEGGGGGGPPRPRMAIALAILAVVVGIVVAIALAGGDGGNTGLPPRPPLGADPKITITNLEDGPEFAEEDEPTASFDCIPAKGTKIVSCDGSIEGRSVEKGDPLTMSADDHTLHVTAIQDDGREWQDKADYSVESEPVSG